MDICSVTHEGSVYTFHEENETGDRYWFCQHPGLTNSKIIAGMLVPMVLSQQLYSAAIKSGISPEKFAVKPKASAVYIGSGEPRIKTKIKLFGKIEKLNKALAEGSLNISDIDDN